MIAEKIQLTVNIEDKAAALSRLHELVADGNFNVQTVSEVIQDIYKSIRITTKE